MVCFRGKGTNIPLFCSSPLSQSLAVTVCALRGHIHVHPTSQSSPSPVAQVPGQNRIPCSPHCLDSEAFPLHPPPLKGPHANRFFCPLSLALPLGSQTVLEAGWGTSSLPLPSCPHLSVSPSFLLPKPSTAFKHTKCV